MLIERYGIKWSLKPKGYYQSTKPIDGKRRWLHQYTYELYHGVAPDGHHIHHRDGDKANNDISNLECLTPKEHIAKHPRPEHWAAISVLGRAAIKAGVKSRRKVRAELDKTRPCGYCGVAFTPHPHARDNAQFCSDACRSKGRRGNTIASFTESRWCKFCGTAFTPPPRGFAQALFCSTKCFDSSRYTNKTISRKCASCGTSYTLHKGHAPTYCPSCIAAGANAKRYERTCTCCGRPIVSRVEHGNTFCDRGCTNKYRRLGLDPARLERYQAAVRASAVDPRDRVPADL